MYARMYVSYPAPRSSVTAEGSNIHLGNEGLTDHTVEHCVGFVDSRTDAHTNTIKATWKHANLTLGLTEETRLNE